jgi:PAS domain S-box-containing protein
MAEQFNCAPHESASSQSDIAVGGTANDVSDGPEMDLLPVAGGPLAGWLDAGVASLDLDGGILAINTPLAGWLEHSAELLHGRAFWPLLLEQCPEWSNVLSGFQATEQTFSTITLHRPASASTPGQWLRLEAVRHPSGATVRIQSLLPPREALEAADWEKQLGNESARRELFIRLARAEAQLESLSNHWPGVIFSQRADFSFRFASPRLAELAGAGEAAGHSPGFWDFVHPDDAAEVREQIQRARQTRQPVTSTYRIRHAQTGRVSYVLEHRDALLSPGGLILGYEGVWLDVTRQTLGEKRLSGAAWKEALSQITTVLAHDFSNVMAGIHALSESFLDQVGTKHEFTEGLQQIRDCTLQAGKLVHRIVGLHQGKPGAIYFHNLNELATDVADLARKMLPRRMSCTLELAPESLPVFLDAVEFRQIVLSLILNAVDAMPADGQLVLRTSLHRELPTLKHLGGTPPRAPVLCFSIQDNGRGIAAKHLANLFEPFFTTKPAQKGSGLSLYNARVFAEKHRGAVAVDSQENLGTKVALWLPQADFSESETEMLNRNRDITPAAPNPEKSS